MGTVIFFVVLFGAVVGAYFVARATPKNIEPVAVDGTWSSIADFYRDRPERDAEVELGDGWSSAVDPGAELRAVLDQPDPRAGRAAPSGACRLRVRRRPDRGRAAWLDPRATGMKVLAVVDLETVQATHPDQMRSSSDGLDRLTARLGRPYEPPHSSDPHWASVSGDPTPGDADEGGS